MNRLVSLHETPSRLTGYTGDWACALIPSHGRLRAQYVNRICLRLSDPQFPLAYATSHHPPWHQCPDDGYPAGHQELAGSARSGRGLPRVEAVAGMKVQSIGRAGAARAVRCARISPRSFRHPSGAADPDRRGLRSRRRTGGVERRPPRLRCAAPANGQHRGDRTTPPRTRRTRVARGVRRARGRQCRRTPDAVDRSPDPAGGGLIRTSGCLMDLMVRVRAGATLASRSRSKLAASSKTTLAMALEGSTTLVSDFRIATPLPRRSTAIVCCPLGDIAGRPSAPARRREPDGALSGVGRSHGLAGGGLHNVRQEVSDVRE